MTIPGITVPMNKNTVIPHPEAHFSFSTKLMVLAIELYLREMHLATSVITPTLPTRSFSNLSRVGKKCLPSHTGSLLSMLTTNSFSMKPSINLHAQEQGQKIFVIVQVNSSHQPGLMANGYVWIAARDKIVHIPKDHAEDVDMQKGDTQEEDEQEDTLPTLEVSIRPQPQEKEKEEDVCSQKGEETSHHSGHF